MPDPSDPSGRSPDDADLRLAFAAPADRAAASPEAALPDRLLVTGHVVEVEIGAFEEERGHLQRLRFDIVVEIAPQAGAGDGVGDDVDRILSYDRLTEAVADELAASRFNLLETLAEGVAARILAEPQALRVFLRIQKLDRGNGDLGVEIMRRSARDPGLATAPETAPATAPVSAPLTAPAMVPVTAPVLVLVAGAALAAADLAPVVAGLAAEGPLLLCAEDVPPRPVAATAGADRRVALLALDQAAWLLSARLETAIVAASRTEMDWALRRGRTVIWAPGKLALDAGEGAGVGAVGGDGAESAALPLLRWLAPRIGAARLLRLAPGPDAALAVTAP